ncbi:thiol:disulfide interchange protein DsbA/DsbL [Pelomonas sp. SE-A7]|uniref:thiol:disulfide interchange protein DsbA/DsbL n=1 Tax=Pelomonas sp. SE-A7 TaxID=3054953 RepID=UPI00259D1CC7|nr:thiol:disulfide interchange protein DsbA/DsbL [Pelomonas sp. SE-A7]MDM4767357.1 thiol:disulfide interchange protein DsbA/DsbL [Pelomonas sp. SE-A7]
MTTTRREFIQQAGGLAATTLALPAWAQGKPVEGQHYRKLQNLQPVASKTGEVIEFFWYGCPHCYRFEPTLNQWLARKPAQLAFRRSPAIIHGASKAHQRIFFALQGMGLAESLHAQVFAAVQADPAALGELAEIQGLMKKLGVDTAKFAQQYESFTVQARCQQATALIRSYMGDTYTVPTLAVNGRYLTSPSMAGGEAQAIEVLNYLLTLPRG